MKEESKPELVRPEEPEALHPTLLDEKQGKQIRLFSRIGVWSLVVGMTPVAADILSSTWGWGIDPGSLLPDLGLIVGGFGTLVASTLVTKALGKELKPVKLAALAGIPFGLTLVMLGSMLLTEAWFPPTAFMQTLFSFGLGGALILGVSLVVLLIIGFVGSESEEGEVQEDFR